MKIQTTCLIDAGPAAVPHGPDAARVVPARLSPSRRPSTAMPAKRDAASIPRPNGRNLGNAMHPLLGRARHNRAHWGGPVTVGANGSRDDPRLCLRGKQFALPYPLVQPVKRTQVPRLSLFA